MLKLAIDLYARKPSRNRAVFLEMAINRFAAGGNLTKPERALLDKAVDVLTQTSIPPPGSAAPSAGHDSIWTWVYEHSDYRGNSFFIDHANWENYKQIRASTLKANHLHDAISSVKLWCGPNPEVQGDVYLFQDDRYSGRYVHYSAAVGTETDIDYVGGQINDATSSILVVRHWENELSPAALGDYFSRSDIADYVRQKKGIASLRGDPIFTWDMWPEGDGHPTDPQKTYIYIRIPCVADVPDWFDYDAELRFWILPWVDQNGQLQAAVDWYGAWVEGGIIADEVLDKVMKKVEGSVGDVNSRLQSGLTTVNAFGPYSSVYLLPGRNEAQGNTTDDVSIVLVKSVPQPGGDGPIL